MDAIAIVHAVVLVYLMVVCLFHSCFGLVALDFGRVLGAVVVAGGGGGGGGGRWW